jgi:nitrile hydratase
MECKNAVNGIHDLGGMDNLGALHIETNEPVFHHDWERKVFSFAIALLGARYFRLDEVRRASEWMPPADYLRAPYYDGWLYGLTALLLEKDILTREELDAGRSLRQEAGRLLPAFPPAMAEYILNNPIPAKSDANVSPRFRPGDAVVTRNIHSTGHTRLPRYARGKSGVVEQDHGIFPFSDSIAHGGPERPQHVYSVCFPARELWGEDTRAEDSVNIDLFDDYLDPL